MDSMWTTIRCGKCRGCGETFPPSDESAEREDQCLRCRGDAYIVPVTIKEKGSTKRGKPPKREAGADDGDELEGTLAASWFDEDALAERGRVSRELDAIGRAAPAVGAALASFYGIDGDKWGPHKWGRLFALWPHTRAGHALAEDGARRSKRGHGFLVGALDLIATERDAEERAGAADRNHRRRALIARANVEARQLYDRMRRAIHEAEAG